MTRSLSPARLLYLNCLLHRSFDNGEIQSATAVIDNYQVVLEASYIDAAGTVFVNMIDPESSSISIAPDTSLTEIDPEPSPTARLSVSGIRTTSSNLGLSPKSQRLSLKSALRTAMSPCFSSVSMRSDSITVRALSPLRSATWMVAAPLARLAVNIAITIMLRIDLPPSQVLTGIFPVT